jgi:hypothetical protein
MALITERRDVRDFTEVALQGYGDLVVEQATDPGAAESLVIEADKNMLPTLQTFVRDGRLILRQEAPWWNPAYWIDWLFMDKRLHYRVTMKQVNGVSISGSGSARADRLQSDRCNLSISGSGRFAVAGLEVNSLATDISGSGRVELSGKAGGHAISISGSGTVLAAGLETQNTTVRISGSGVAEVNASQALDITMSGAGDVRYLGSPKVTQSISGSGRVRQMSA